MSMILDINEYGDFMCGMIKQRLLDDYSAGNIRVWTEGPPDYSPEDNYGDRHNGPGVTHITGLALTTNWNLQATLVHETAHAFGYSDAHARSFEQMCRGGAAMGE
jgi:hypothetical protein